MKVSGFSSPSSEFSIVLIEPDEDFARDFAVELRALGYELEHYRSVRELGYIGRLKDFDLLLTNQKIDDMSGMELVEYSRKLLSGIPVIIFTDELDGQLECRAPLVACYSKKMGAKSLALEVLQTKLIVQEPIGLTASIDSQIVQESS